MSKKVLVIRNAEFHDFGGGERFPIFLSQSLLKAGYSGLVVSRSPSLLAFAKENNVKFVRGLWWRRQNWSSYRVLLFPIYIIWQLVLYFWYLILIIRENPIALHIQGKDDFIAGTLAAKTLGRKIVWTDHADLKHIFKNLYIWYKNPVGKIVYLCGLLADNIVYVSENEKYLICKNLSPSSPLRVKMILVHNGVQDSNGLYSKENNRDQLIYGLASRLVTDKGIGEAISAFIRINKAHTKTKLVIYGDGPEANKFKRKAEGNRSIIFKGHVTNPLPVMKNIDIFLQPTYHEAFSVVLVEASMLGLPIIATRVGGNPEIIIDHKTGILVDPQNTDSLYDAMEELYKNKILRDDLGKAARKQYLEKFNFDDIVKNQYIPLYEK
jgi:glycosyltransferase involved in cell wall biosynthesis